jgi:hypothetical protein
MRSADRDLASDNARLQQLVTMLETLEQECSAEERGLRARFDSSQKQAAAVLATQEAGDDSAALKLRLDGYENSMMQCERRLSQLEEHRAYFADLRRQVEIGPLKQNGPLPTL